MWSLRRTMGPGPLRGGCLLRWLGLKICRRSTLVFALLWFGTWVFLNGLVFVHRTILSDYCTDDKSKRILQRVCEEYREGALTGDLCEDLCVSGQVEYKRCLYYENGKKVIEARWRGTPVVLKSKLENFSSYESLGLLEYQDPAEELAPLDVVFYATLEIRNSLGLDMGGNASLPPLWGQRLRERGRPYSRAELASLWSLLQQEEYVFLRVLQDLSRHVAKVLGSCGHFYAVEYLSAGHAWDQNIFSLEELSAGPWTARDMVHRIALSFLDMAWRFDNDFSHRLHLCDIKPENFAIRKDLTVVAIDVDMAFFEPKMRDILEQNCTNDDDCNFFDCISECNMKTNKCSSKRRNSNLQVICQKIFRPWFSPTLLGAKAGLPLQVDLQRAVQECAETPWGEDEEHPQAVQKRLLHLLTRLLHQGTASERGGADGEGIHSHTALNF
ncbi:divergent protein kinase domain 1C [Oncorhynchus mykiss]|uniref:Divergent protein kinase domain 1C n=2 Tax=Oncorhynchus mykiss TaxID=8022 RepID=A0A8C7SA10_ONCMY|nr:divergent protein kinase domain 1C [Oncorhynchus mykiss]